MMIWDDVFIHEWVEISIQKKITIYLIHVARLSDKYSPDSYTVSKKRCWRQELLRNRNAQKVTIKKYVVMADDYLSMGACQNSQYK